VLCAQGLFCLWLTKVELLSNFLYMEKLIGLKDLRQNMSSYAKKVQEGRSFIVLKQSKPIFRIVPLDIWGDEGEWETLVDFTKFYKDGIPAKELLRRLRSIK